MFRVPSDIVFKLFLKALLNKPWTNLNLQQVSDMLDQSTTSQSSQKLTEYLLSQNRQLSDQVSDLRELVKMNKIQINILSKNNPENKYIEVISNYRLANENYQKKVETLERKIEDINSEKLMLEQLQQQSAQELKALEQLHRDRTEALQQIIQELETKAVGLEKNMRSYDSLTGFVERNKEIYNPTEQAIEFKAKEEQMADEVHLVKMEMQREKENQDNLLKINGILRHKVVTLQAKLAMPNKNLGEILDKSLKRLMMYFIQTQKRILTGEESDSEGEEDLELIAPELATYFGDEALKRQKNCNVPHLDLLKIRGSIANGNVKIKQQLLKRNHLSKEEKIERLQIELQYTRRELTKNIIDLREEKDRRKWLQRICEQLESRNQIITESYQKIELKLQKYLKKAKESKDKQLKFIELDDTLNDISTTIIKHDNNVVDQKKARAQDKHRTAAPVLAEDIFDTMEEYKIHLQLLAKDLNKNEKVHHLDRLKKKEEHEEEGWRPRLKRSTSNPFLYFNERREEIMEVGALNNRPEQKMRMEQTQIFGQGFRLEEDDALDGIDI